MTDQEKGQEASKVQFTEISGEITTLNPSWSSYLSNLNNLNNLDNLQYLRSINHHLWWIALVAKFGLISMVISFLIMSSL